ncbi:MAG: twin-arginine translocase subunit TatC [Planctomycetota bacterium]
MVQLDDPQLGRELEQPEGLERMSFGDHLDELRSRVIKALLAILVAVIAVLPFKQIVQGIIVRPYRVQWKFGFDNWIAKLKGESEAGVLDPIGEGFLTKAVEIRDTVFEGTYRWTGLIEAQTGFRLPYTMFSTNVLEDIMSFFWASLIFSLILASPVVIWQIWAFVGAGLYKHERAVFYRYFPFMMLLIAGGVSFGYFVALPYTIAFLVSMMDPSMVGAIFAIGPFLNLVFMTTAAMGVLFQVPIVMLALQKVGLVKHESFIKHWRITVLVMFVASALFSPPEPVSMVLMAMPMIVLYGVGLILTRAGRKNERKSEDPGDSPPDAPPGSPPDAAGGLA